MKNLTVGRYEPNTSTDPDNPNGVRGFSGWVEPADRSWIVFLDLEGKPSLYYGTREESGAVVGPPFVLDHSAQLDLRALGEARQQALTDNEVDGQLKSLGLG